MEQVLFQSGLCLFLHYTVLPSINIQIDNLERNLLITFYITQLLYVLVYFYIFVCVSKQNWLARTVPVLLTQPSAIIQGFVI